MTTQAEAITRAGAHLAAARDERDETAWREGPEGAARWACPNGTSEERAAVAALWERLQNEARGGPTAA